MGTVDTVVVELGDRGLGKPINAIRFDSFGNLDATPPIPGHPVGRIYHGLDHGLDDPDGLDSVLADSTAAYALIDEIDPSWDIGRYAQAYGYATAGELAAASEADPVVHAALVSTLRRAEGPAVVAGLELALVDEDAGVRLAKGLGRRSRDRRSLNIRACTLDIRQ